MATKIGEIQTEIISDVKKSDILKTINRINFGAKITTEPEFKLSENLKKGDKIKITIEKI
jgi:hypothetical protein